MQSTLDDHMLRHDIVEALLSQGATERTDAERYADRLVDLSEQEGEHQGLLDPFDRSVALVFALIEESGLDPWAVDLGAFVRIFSEARLSITRRPRPTSLWAIDPSGLVGPSSSSRGGARSLHRRGPGA